jgi:hypothetical protein
VPSITPQISVQLRAHLRCRSLHRRRPLNKVTVRFVAKESS